MGRAVSNQGWRYWGWQKKRSADVVEEYLMTPEEVEQSAKFYSQRRRLEMAARPEPRAVPLLDPSAYGNWRLPPGHENWVQDRIKAMMETPFPEMFCPPLPRVQLHQVMPPMFSPRPAYGEVFKEVYPELIEQARAYLERTSQEEEECEGAVGYDQEYYATPYLIRRWGRRRAPPALFRGPSYMDARRLAQLAANDRKLQAAMARKMVKTQYRKKLLKKCMARRRWRKWLRLNRMRPRPPVRRQAAGHERLPGLDELEELVLTDFENLCLDSASGYSSDASATSLMEFIRLERSLE